MTRQENHKIQRLGTPGESGVWAVGISFQTTDAEKTAQADMVCTIAKTNSNTPDQRVDVQFIFSERNSSAPAFTLAAATIQLTGNGSEARLEANDNAIIYNPVSKFPTPDVSNVRVTFTVGYLDNMTTASRPMVPKS